MGFVGGRYEWVESQEQQVVMKSPPGPLVSNFHMGFPALQQGTASGGIIQLAWPDGM